MTNSNKYETKSATLQEKLLASMRSLASASKTNLKKFWKYASTQKPRRHSVTKLSVNGNTISNPGNIAEALNQQFKSVFTPPDNDLLPQIPEYDIQKPMQIITVGTLDVESQLKRLNPNKSVGPDGVHPRTLKEAHAELALPLAKLFQKSLDTKQVPQDWRNANITPVHKGGSRNCAANYQPISITSTVSKILEGIANTAVMKHLIDNKLLTNSQHGFTSGCSVETNLIDAYECVTKLLDQGIPVDMILLDFAKAFDKVCHCCLKAKLLATGIHVEVVEWVMQFLSGRKQRVRVFGDNGQEFFSEVAGVDSGVPQGTILGPTLFNIYINDAPRAVRNKMSFYADDAKLIGPSESSATRATIQEDLDALSLWACQWKLEFNIQKCKAVYFGKKNEKWQYHMSGGDGSRQSIGSSVA